jgi:hypothetical protein
MASPGESAERIYVFASATDHAQFVVGLFVGHRDLLRSRLLPFDPCLLRDAQRNSIEHLSKIDTAWQVKFGTVVQQDRTECTAAKFHHIKYAICRPLKA